MIEYKLLTAEEAQQRVSELGDVLQACVKDGASVGFIDPADRPAIDNFWKDKIASLARHECDLFIALDNETVAATVMVNYCATPNGRHRAEITKLLVHPQSRRQGIARQLMLQAEQRAWGKGLALLVLDTRSGDVASDLYRSLGWLTAGSIPFYARSVENTLDSTTYMYKVNETRRS
ncbi:GNAT family N-acetyltransferase [Leclercia adecarboxylata]|uniref:GNAT family N-acetyltransferase n=1 Tax=Leclercia adecarboxylata TaxID=83655 RepID=UPI002DB90CA4|nr:GNAT family N-acetyltransferase [Leclercia adecarboxylata]MEB6377886.1 GNAT family N-acetyltransferase [Leclercia adecarboxylata]